MYPQSSRLTPEPSLKGLVLVSQVKSPSYELSDDDVPLSYTGKPASGLLSLKEERPRVLIVKRPTCRSETSIVVKRGGESEDYMSPPACNPPRPSYQGGPCQVPGCDRMNAKYKCQGFFCEAHCKRLQIIRERLFQAKRRRDIPREFKWRVQEIMCRRHTDSGHWYRVCDIAQTAPARDYFSYLKVLRKLRTFLKSFKGGY